MTEQEMYERLHEPEGGWASAAEARADYLRWIAGERQPPPIDQTACVRVNASTEAMAECACEECANELTRFFS
ncbi:MAG TPA: hypothetical protein VFH61_08500 [Thermoleophilia bacterium]|nr:hypothetical protein [Thermoleophilia bacterium]